MLDARDKCPPRVAFGEHVVVPMEVDAGRHLGRSLRPLALQVIEVLSGWLKPRRVASGQTSPSALK
jgi:hypothetical protein